MNSCATGDLPSELTKEYEDWPKVAPFVAQFREAAERALLGSKSFFLRLGRGNFSHSCAITFDIGSPQRCTN